jgi:hypothetical protein
VVLGVVLGVRDELGWLVVTQPTSGGNEYFNGKGAASVKTGSAPVVV